MGIDAAKNKNTDPPKRSLMRRILARFAAFSDWIAKGYEENPPCVG
jgi:hypothetical protein